MTATEVVNSFSFFWVLVIIAVTLLLIANDLHRRNIKDKDKK